MDNIDHNPSSTTSKDSFHGTAISVIQYPTIDNPGQKRIQNIIDPNVPKRKDIMPLPVSYADVPPAALHNSRVYDPPVDGNVFADHALLNETQRREEAWLANVTHSLAKDIGPTDSISWSAYHASTNGENDTIKSMQ